MTDIHGRADLLQQLFRVIDRDIAASSHIRPIHVFLGDYIDRGAYSRQTIDLLIDRARRFECVFLKGNHEMVFLEMLAREGYEDHWLRYGGLQTLLSYGVQPSPKFDKAERAALIDELRHRIPPTHVHFMQSLRPCFACGDFFFVHAGVRPDLPLNEQNDKDLCWIRDEFLLSTKKFEKFIVHGHSPVDAPDRRPNRINIDTGAYATDNLTLLSIQGDRMLAV